MTYIEEGEHEEMETHTKSTWKLNQHKFSGRQFGNKYQGL